MDILLSANPKLLDKTDEDGVWIPKKFVIIQICNFTPICDDNIEYRLIFAVLLYKNNGCINSSMALNNTDIPVQ